MEPIVQTAGKSNLFLKLVQLQLSADLQVITAYLCVQTLLVYPQWILGSKHGQILFFLTNLKCRPKEQINQVTEAYFLTFTAITTKLQSSRVTVSAMVNVTSVSVG